MLALFIFEGVCTDLLVPETVSSEEQVMIYVVHFIQLIPACSELSTGAIIIIRGEQGQFQASIMPLLKVLFPVQTPFNPYTKGVLPYPS